MAPGMKVQTKKTKKAKAVYQKAAGESISASVLEALLPEA